MGKLKDILLKINAKVPLLKITILLCAVGNVYAAYMLVDPFTFQPDFFVLYGLEDAGKVRARVEEQMRRYKPKPEPPPKPAPTMAYDVRILKQHNPFLPPGMVEQTGQDKQDKFTDVTGIDLIGTVYSHTPFRRTALIEMNGAAYVVREGSNIRGTNKKVVEVGRSFVKVQEEGLLPSPVYLPNEHGLDNLVQALASNEYKTNPGWKYSPRRKGGVVAKPTEEDASAEEGGGGKKKGKKAKQDEAVATDEEAAATDEEAAATADEEAAAADEEAAAADEGGGEE